MDESENKVCPKCGMQLVGKNNYCMGCGVNVDPYASDGSSGGDGSFVKVYGNGTEYSGPNGRLERMKKAQVRREKSRKKDILQEGGLASALLMLIGISAGVVCGILLLRWYFAPKEETVALHGEWKVVDYAGVDRIDPPDEEAFADQPDEHGVIDRRNQESSTVRHTADGTAVRRADPERQKFKGTLVLESKGDAVTRWTEEQVWDVKGLDPSSVTYVVNNLNYHLDEFQEYIFIDCEIVQTSQEVTVRRTYRNLEIESNILTLARRGVIDAEVVKKSGGKRIISQKRLLEYLDGQGWKVDGTGTTVIYVD